MSHRHHTAITKLFILAVAGLIFAVNFAPSDWLRIKVLTALGDPPYAGAWALFAHVFLYSTLTAFAALAAWLIFSSLRWTGPVALGAGRRPVLWGLAGAIVTIAMTLVFFQVTAPDAIHYIPPKPWIIGGNVFSNFYEELIFRGFLLAALTAVFGFWPAAILSSIAFGAVHAQYPVLVQLLVAAAGFVYCIVMKQSRTLWAPWISHMGLDLVIDMLVG